MGNKSCSRVEEYAQNEAKGQKLTVPSPAESIYTIGCFGTIPQSCYTFVCLGFVWANK